MAEVEQWIEGEMQRLDAEAYVEQPQEMPEKEEEKPAGE